MTRDDGFVTLAVAGLALVLAALASVVVALGAVGVARHAAASAADLAALSAARHALEGSDAACGAARRVALRQGARVVTCELVGLDAWLQVVVRPTGPLGSLGVARATAHAGPGS